MSSNNDNTLLEQIPKDPKIVSDMQILNLAYIGDAVFELMVRTHIINTKKATANQLHKLSKSYVRASAQAEMYKALTEALTEAEMAVMKRGRNAKSQSKAKNASVVDYRYATGMEALFGYLYLKNETARLLTLFEICLKSEVSVK